MTEKRSINWKIAGKAGEGIAVTGEMFAKTCVQHSMNVFAYGELPSLIRGGHNTMQVSASVEPMSCQRRILDVLVALDVPSVTLHQAECTPQTLILVDTDLSLPANLESGTRYQIPLTNISKQITGSTLASDVVALGASCYFLGLKLEVLKIVIKEAFLHKGEEVVAKNQQAAEQGYAAAQTLGKPVAQSIDPKPNTLALMNGSEAIGLGALASGIQFYSAYPMTPASGVLHFLAAKQDSYPLVVKHAEDEISAINQAIGASYAGVRAMTGTSGGGFALMVEAVSLAGMAEVPLVVVEGQRPGPATGLPTWTCQADLQFVMRAGHGEFPKIVFTPGTMEECFKLTRLAFYLAEKYHTQAYLLTDKLLLESLASVAAFSSTYTNQRYSMAADADLPTDGSYQRFVDTPEGYSPRSIPGQPNGVQLTNSYEHDAHGFATEDADTTKKMVEKRLRKLTGILAELPVPELVGPSQAEVTFVCWGSTKLALLEVVRAANEEKPGSVNVIHLHTMMPFPIDAFAALAKSAKKLVMVEGNAMGQGEAWIREQTGIVMHDHIRRYDGRPFYAEDISAWLQKGGH